MVRWKYFKIFLVVLIVGVFFCSDNLASGKNFDISQIDWLIKKTEIKENLSDAFYVIENEKILAYRLEVFGMDSFLVFYFDEKDSLWGMTVLFRNAYEDKNLYLKDYEYLKKILTGKYGTPFIDGISKNGRLQFGMNNSLHSTYWITGKTIINLDLKEQKDSYLLYIDHCDIMYYLRKIEEKQK